LISAAVIHQMMERSCNISRQAQNIHNNPCAKTL